MEFHFNTAFENMMTSHKLDTVVLLGHMNPDGDAAGSVMGLAHYIHAVYPQYRVLPYLDETLDKGPKKQVRVDSLFCPFEKPEAEHYAVIVCDTSTKARMIGIDLYEKAGTSMVIDHHAANEGYGEVNYTKISEACAENIYYILDWKRWQSAGEECHPNAADYIYLGILHDTSCFTRAAETTFQAASGLLALGVDHNYVMLTMQNDTLEGLQRRGTLFGMAKRVMGGKTAYVIINQEQLKKYDIQFEEIHPISGFLRGCEEIELGFTMYEEEPDVWRCSFRSDGKWINVNELMKPFGGGGHAGAAGLRKETDRPDQLLADILKLASEMTGQDL